jgi:signal transduction protein with GAF and PtsI domain
MPDEFLAAYHKIADHISSGDTVDEALASAVEFATVLLGCDECCTYVRQGDELVPWVWKHTKHGSLQRTPFPVDCGFAASARMHRAPIAVSSDSVKGATFKIFEEWSSDPGETFICAPFLSRSQLVGAITLRYRRPRAYSRFEFKFLLNIGYMLGTELGIARLEKENSDLVLELETRKLVERGKGILQRDMGMSEHEAYLALQRQSRQTKRPLKDIAEAIILGAEIRLNAVQME